MADKNMILSADAEEKLLKPIDEYVGKIQAQIDELRVDGSDKVRSLKNHIAIAKEDKNLSKEEKDSIIAKDKAALEKAKAVEAANKDKVAKLIADAEGYLKEHYDSEYYSKVVASCEAEKAAENESYERVKATLKTEHEQTLAKLSDPEEIKDEKYVYKNKLFDAQMTHESRLQEIKDRKHDAFSHKYHLIDLLRMSKYTFMQSRAQKFENYKYTFNTTQFLYKNGLYAVFMISELAKLLRISLSKGRTVIRIADEIQHSTSYMNIQKVRYKERFATEFIIDEEINDYCTVKLIVQPILENAIYYGVGNMDEDDGGKITVRGEKKGDDIYISVEDNGMGMSEEVARNILVDNNKVPKHGSGVGVINVHSRIKLMFGSEYGLKVYSEPDEGTKVVIHIPAIPYTEENRERLERQDFGRGMVTDEEE